MREPLSVERQMQVSRFFLYLCEKNKPMVNVIRDQYIMNKIYVVLLCLCTMLILISCDGALFSSGYCEGLNITPNEFWSVNSKKNVSFESSISIEDIEIIMEDTEMPLNE